MERECIQKMKKHNFTKSVLKILSFSILFNILSPVFSEDTTPLPYEKDEIPQGLKDLRRFEIITLGAIPFVMLDTSLAYSGYRYYKNDFKSEYAPSLFGSNFTQEEQKNIILTSIGISVCIGITDYIFQIIKRSKAKKTTELLNYDDISITPLSEDKEALKVVPSSEKKVKDIVEDDDVQEVEE